ncbi:MAG: tetratricopeptide repeat protein [Candidatus Omnitrophota bacterium]
MNVRDGLKKWRVFLLLALILVLTGAALALVSDSYNYRAERFLYRTLQHNRSFLAMPETASPALVAGIEKDLQALVRTYPRSGAVRNAQTVLAEFYLFNRRFDEALAQVDTLLRVYSRDRYIASTAQFLKGVAYEKEGKWEKARREYAILQREYPETTSGMNVPVYIAQYYLSKKMTKEAAREYAYGAFFYRRLARQLQGTPRGYRARSLLMQVLACLNKYEEAGRVLEETIELYPGTQTYEQQLPNIETIYEKILKRPDQVLALYKKIYGRMTDRKAKEALQAKIARVQSRMRAP